MKKRVLSLFLAFVLCLTLLPTATFAADETDRPQGTGTTEDPYLIGTLDELKWFRDTVNEGKPGISAKLTADIVLEENTWTPIGDSSNAYTGTFNGGWHKISGTEITADTQNWGLFGSIGEDGTVQALTVNISTFGVTANAAQSSVIAAQNAGTIERCAVQISTKFTFKVSVGLIAYENSGLIENCRGAMVGPSSYNGDAVNVAGIAYMNSGTVKSCYFHGQGRWRNYAVDYAITSSLDSGTVENCYCYDTNSLELGNRYLDETRKGIDKVTMWNSSLGYTLASGQVAWLLNNGKGAATNNTEPWRQETATYGAPTLDPSDRRVTKKDDGTYTLETPHTHQVNGELKEFAAFDVSNPADSGNYYLDGDVTLDGAWTITGDTVLCLNGKTLTTAETANIVVESGTLTLIPHDKNTAGTITGLGGSIVTVRGGALMMQGGTISGNTSGIGVLLTGGSFAMQGGEISGCAVGVSVQGGTLTLSGSAKVSENTRNILLAENQKISFGTLNGDAKFGISVEGQETLTDRVAVTDETGGQYFGQLAADGFKEDGTGFELYLSEDGKAVTLGKQAVHTHCICGAGYVNSGHTGHADVTFQPWTKTDSLPQEGNYYLTRNVTLTNDATLKSANICLNGYTVTLSGSATRIRAGVYGTDGCWGSLTDCVGKGTVTGGGVYIWYNGKVNLYSGTLRSTRVEISQTGGGTFNLYGGTITGNETTVAPVDGQNSDKITVNMYGGEISGNRNTSENEDEGGGGVYVGQGNQFNMYGGTIKNNSAKNGGGVRIAAAGTTYGSGTFTMSGGEISGNTASGKGGGVYVGGWINVSGSAEIYDNTGNGGANNVYLPGGKAITLTGELLGTHPIGVTTAAAPADGKPVIIVRGSNDYTIKAADQDHFTSDVDNSYEMNLTGNALELAVKPHVHPVSTGANVTWKPLGSEAELRGVTAVTRDSCYYYLTSDIALTTETWKPASGMVLDLNGHSITAQDAFDTITVGDGVSFTLVDCKGGGESTNYGFVTHFKNPNNNTKPRVSGRGVMVSDGGHFIMYGGCVGPNQTTDAGAGVYVAEGGHFAMYGGEIVGNVEPATGGSTGGGIWTAGTTTIGGSATVTGNRAQAGGGVYVAGGTLTLEGSAIVKGNTANNTYGSGVFVGTNGQLCVSGNVQVTGNTYNSIVGNVYLEADSNKNIKAISVVGELTGSASICLSLPNDVLNTINDSHSVTIATADTEGWIKSDSFTIDGWTKYAVNVTDDGKTAVLGPHIHQWVYTSSPDGTFISAGCTEPNCTADGGTVTISVANDTYTYDGNGKAATLEGEFKTGAATPVVAYTLLKDRNYIALPAGETVPTSAGQYKASITVGDATASVEYTIKQAKLGISDFTFTPPENQVYDGTEKLATVTSDKIASDYINVTYWLPKNEYGWPSAQSTANAGTYFVRIWVKENTNYEAITDTIGDEKNWTFTISPATDYTVSVPASWQNPINVIEGSTLGAALNAITQTGSVTVTATGVKGETLVGNVTWYIDEACMTPVNNTAAVSGTAGTTVQLYWKFTLTDEYQKNYATDAKIGSVSFKIVAGTKQELSFKDAGGVPVTAGTKKYGNWPFTLNTENSTDPLGEVTITYESSDPVVATIAVESKNEITVTICGVGTTTITATAAMVPGKYAETTATYTLTVEQGEWDKAVSVAMLSYVYNGTDAPPTPDLHNYSSGDPNAVTYYYSTTDTNSGGTEWKDIGPTTLHPGTYYIYAEIAETTNYKAYTTKTSKFTVYKAYPICTSPAGLTAIYGQKLNEITLTNPAGNTPGTWSWVDGTQSVGEVGTNTFEATFTPTDSANYETRNIDVTVTVRKANQATLVIVSKDSVVYGQTLQLGASGGSGTGKVTYAVNNSTGEATIDANTGVLTPVKAGTVKVTASKAEDVNYNAATSAEVEITISKATPTGAPKYTTITSSGKTLKDAALTTDGSNLKPNDGKLEWVDDKGDVLPDDTKVEANKTYKWRFTPTDKNYEVLTGEVELYHVSYSGGGSYTPTYPVSTPSKTENGSVSVSPKNASKGDTVTITVKPDSGYQLDDLTATDKSGNDLKLTDKGNGKYTFVMPAGKVEVKASFVEEIETSPFDDVATDAYYYEAVKWAADKGITGGIGNDLFGPDQPCTRAQIVTFLWRAAGSPEPKGTAATMTDVVSGSYYAKAVAWAIENGITTGTTATTFSPDATCTRAQAVTFLARALNAKASGKAEFSDVPVDSYFAEAVAWAAANGVTTGIGGGLFGPNNSCTRAQIVTFLWRAYTK